MLLWWYRSITLVYNYINHQREHLLDKIQTKIQKKCIFQDVLNNTKNMSALHTLYVCVLFSTNLDLGHCLTMYITNFKFCSFTANTVGVIKHSKVQKYLFYRRLYNAHINMIYDIRIKSNQQQHKLIKDIASLYKQ